MVTAEWYFDFVSPFAYLQLPALAHVRTLAHVRMRPVVFAGILQDNGQKGPAEIPQKRRFTYRHVQWLAESHAIPLRFPPAHPFNPLRALRLSVALHSEPQVVSTIFRHIWQEGRAPDEPADWQHLCASLGVTDADSRISEQWVKDELRENGNRARAAGVFGVPSLVIDGEIFWGADATGMALDYLRDPERFRTGEYARVADLPVGAQRRSAQ